MLLGSLSWHIRKCKQQSSLCSLNSQLCSSRHNQLLSGWQPQSSPRQSDTCATPTCQQFLFCSFWFLELCLVKIMLFHVMLWSLVLLMICPRCCNWDLYSHWFHAYFKCTLLFNQVQWVVIKCQHWGFLPMRLGIYSVLRWSWIYLEPDWTKTETSQSAPVIYHNHNLWESTKAGIVWWPALHLSVSFPVSGTGSSIMLLKLLL